MHNESDPVGGEYALTQRVDDCSVVHSQYATDFYAFRTPMYDFVIHHLSVISIQGLDLQ